MKGLANIEAPHRGGWRTRNGVTGNYTAWRGRTMAFRTRDLTGEMPDRCRYSRSGQVIRTNADSGRRVHWERPRYSQNRGLGDDQTASNAGWNVCRDSILPADVRG